MHLRIKANNNTPAYMQIYAALRRKIIRGAFPHGSRLPSKRELAHDCGVSIVTVEHAYQVLCDEGLCETRPRSGFYVRYAPENSFPLSEQMPETDKNETTNFYHLDAISFSAVASHYCSIRGSKFCKNPQTTAAWNCGMPSAVILHEAAASKSVRSRSSLVPVRNISTASASKCLDVTK